MISTSLSTPSQVHSAAQTIRRASNSTSRKAFLTLRRRCGNTTAFPSILYITDYGCARIRNCADEKTWHHPLEELYLGAVVPSNAWLEDTCTMNYGYLPARKVGGGMKDISNTSICSGVRRRKFPKLFFFFFF